LLKRTCSLLSRRLHAGAPVQRVPRGLGLTRTYLIPAGLAGLVASLAFAAGAQATPLVTQSAITSPSDPYYVLDQGQTQTVTIAGTANAPGADVDIDCYQDDGSSGSMIDTVAASVPVQNDGTFSTTVPIANLNASGNSELCRLRAVDSSVTAPTTGLSAFTGPRTAYSYLDLYRTDDYYLFVQQLTTADDYLSLGGCGLDESYSDDPTGAFAGHGFDCNDWVDVRSQSDPSKSGITVDGEPAYFPSAARSRNHSAAGIPVLTIDSVTQDPTTGDVTVVETEPIVFCQGNPPVPATGCATFIPAGVQDHRTITQARGGHVVTIHDAFSSTDGSAHSADLLLENDQAFGTTSNDGNQDYLFPGQSSWLQTTGGESETLPADAIGTIDVRNVTVPDGSPQYPLGAITYFQAPSGPPTFATGREGNQVFDVPENLSVPASGSATLDYAYASDTTADALASDVAISKDAVEPPAVTITAPADGSTVTETPVTVSGTASAGSGVQLVTVDGSPAAVAGDGTWSASLTPAPGAQTVTVSVTSQAGNTASTHEALTYTPPATTSSPTTTALPAGADKTTASRKVRGQSAVLSGRVAAHAGTVNYRFQFGATLAYGRTTGSQTLSASRSAVTVGVAARRLVPGSTYHYRLVVSDSAGRRSYGADRVFRTPRIKPRRVRDHITAYWARQAPYRYRLHGWMVLPRGLSHRSACASAGAVTVKVTRAGHTIAQRRLAVTADCTYDRTLSFTASTLPGSGRLAFHMRFGGNRQLRGRFARTLNVLYGPRNASR
jgi:glucodextranase-like protein